MKRVMGVLVCVTAMTVALHAQTVETANSQNSNLQQATNVIGGGSSSADSDSSAVAQGGTGVGWSDSYSGVNIETTSNYRNRTAPLGTVPPYLPLWNHGGWGTVKGYFANGPTSNDPVYERTFNPRDERDMEQLKDVLRAVPYSNPLYVIPGLLNSISVAFGGPDKLHHGRGFDIANSVIRQRRAKGRPLMVFIDSEIDKDVLLKTGFAYVGKISIEGKETRNWDQVYDATVAEALPWDIDILLVSGGMKGVTVGSNLSFPNGAVGYSQMNYSLSLLGGYAKGVTEGKGKPVISAEAYKFAPRLARKRSLPRRFYRNLQARVKQAEYAQNAERPERPVSRRGNPTGGTPGIRMSQELYDLAGFQEGQRIDYVTVTQTQPTP